MSAQINQKGALNLIDALLTDDVRVIGALIRALAKLGCSCTTRTAEVELEAHQQFCRYRMKIEDIGCDITSE